MSNGIYVGVNSVARKVKQPYIGVNSVARKVAKGYVGANGVARQCFSSGTPISESGLTVGNSVYIKVGGTPTEFLIVHQGLPDASIYDSSCEGTWLLMKNCYTTMTWGSQNTVNNYSTSPIHSYLNGTFLNNLDSGVRSAIKQVNIPYFIGGTTSNYTGQVKNLSTQVFLLSCVEVGKKNDSTQVPDYDGAQLAYFTSDSKRIADKEWWLRSAAVSSNTEYVYYTSSTGDIEQGRCYGTTSTRPADIKGVRPAFIVPNETLVDENFNIVA